MGLFKKKEEMTYFDLPASERKKIVNNAVREANIEQRNLMKEYGGKLNECRVNR